VLDTKTGNIMTFTRVVSCSALHIIRLVRLSVQHESGESLYYTSVLKESEENNCQIICLSKDLSKTEPCRMISQVTSSSASFTLSCYVSPPCSFCEIETTVLSVAF